jgi:hypothetical protein
MVGGKLLGHLPSAKCLREGFTNPEKVSQRKPKLGRGLAKIGLFDFAVYPYSGRWELLELWAVGQATVAPVHVNLCFS